MKSDFFSQKNKDFQNYYFEMKSVKKKRQVPFFVVNCGKIQGQFVISVFKTEIRKWSQI